MLRAFLLLSLAAAAAQAAPKNPDTLIWAERSDMAGIDPARADDVYSASLQRNVYDDLATLSSSATMSADGLVWRFKLRVGPRFHEGEPLTAEDAAYSLQRTLVVGAAEGKSDSFRLMLLGTDAAPGPGVAGLAETLRRARRAVSAEGGDVVIRLPRRAAFLLETLRADGQVLCKRWALAHGDWDGTEAGLARLLAPDASRWLMFHDDGTGPFRVERWDAATREVVLARYDGYWRAPARLRRVVIQTVPELATRVLMLKNGDADMISINSGEESSVLGLADVDVSTGLQGAVRWPAMQFNLKVDAQGNPDLGSGKLDGEGIPPDFFSDRDVRLGFAYAWDARAYVDGFLRGRGRPASGVIPPGMVGYSASGLEFAHDRALAEEHFRRAWGGRLWERGFKLKVLVNEGSAVRPAIMAILKKELAALNPKFQIEPHPVDWSSFVAGLAKSRVTLGLGGSSSAVPDPFIYLRKFYHSDGWNGRAMHYHDPELDRLIEAGETEPDETRRLALIEQAQRRGAQDAFVVILAEAKYDTLRVSRSWVKGYVFDPFFPGAPETSDFYALSKQ